MRNPASNCLRYHSPRKNSRGVYLRGAFTLVEILIVVVILGILAGIVVPLFADAAQASRVESMKMDLHRIRVQIQIYRGHHTGYPTLADFVDQMTQWTNDVGDVETTGTQKDQGYRFGPYLQQMPRNPTFKPPAPDTPVVANTAVGTSHWYYDEVTGDFRANDSDENKEF